MSTYRMVYNGDHKIDAIKAVRKLAGIGLKEAKDAVENKAGLIVYASTCAGIIAEYVLAARPERNCYKMDWSVGEYADRAVIDLRGTSPHMDAVLSECRVLA